MGARAGGFGGGRIAAAALAPLLWSQIYGANTAHAAALATGALCLMVVAAVASYLPARRAAQVDPLVTLRDV